MIAMFHTEGERRIECHIWGSPIGVSDVFTGGHWSAVAASCGHSFSTRGWVGDWEGGAELCVLLQHCRNAPSIYGAVFKRDAACFTGCHAGRCCSLNILFKKPLSLPDYLPFSNAHLNPIRSHIPEIGAAETFITFFYSSSLFSATQPQILD